MADIAVNAAITKLIDIAANLLVEEGSRLYWLREDIEWIQREMRRIQSYLADADSKQERDGSQGITNFINEIRDLAHDIEDIMEEFSPLITKRNRKRKRGFMDSPLMNGCNRKRKRGFMDVLKSIISMLRDGYTAHCLAMEIRKIKRRVEDVDRAKNTFGITESGGSSTWVARRTFSHIEEPNIVGFDEHIESLKAKLLNRSLQHSVISIVGMPGLGKTTLARKVYNSVKSDFECSAWICVSQYPKVKNLLLDVARQVGLVEEWDPNVEINLYEFLRIKRYVIVLDDIWDQQAWDALKVGIPTNSENGSRIIITSCSKSVGLYIGGDSSLHDLRPLNHDDSWKLFSKIVMNPTQNTNGTSDSTELEYLGRQILERCGGMPLAIVVIAGLLGSRTKTEFEWKVVLDSIGQKEECPKILALSYKDLPIELKPCLLYFGTFPKNREISAFKLISKWVAERFVQARGEQLPEDVGEDYLNQLIARNLVQAVRRRDDGRIKSCRIHDLLYDICILEAEKSNFFNTSDNVSRNCCTRVRRVSIQRNGIRKYVSSKNHTPKLRSLQCFGEDEELERNHLKSLGTLRLLRVLDVECRMLISLPDEIGNLSNLRYFGVHTRGTTIDSFELPSTMENLQNLQTFNVRNCSLSYFPTFIWKMKQLRHVFLPKYCDALPVQRSCGLRSHTIEVSLPNLEILSNVDSDCMEPSWLRTFTSMRKLGIRKPSEQVMEVLSSATPISERLEKLQISDTGLGFPLDYSSGMRLISQRLNLSRYHNLHQLSLKGIMGKLPKADKLPPNLTKFVLRNCYLEEEDPLEELKNLPKLKILILDHCSHRGEKMMCSGGADTFPQLQVLEICSSKNLEVLSVEEGGMPRLKELRVHECLSLREMPDRLRDIMMRY